MDVKKKCEIAETIGEVILGGAIGILARDIVYDDRKSGCEKAIVTIGIGIGSWMAGRAFAKQCYKFCNGVFGTDFDTKNL